MAGLRAERPPEFTDDELWWGIFTKKSLVVFLITAGIALLGVKLFSLIQLTSVAVILGMLFVLGSVGIVIIPVPGTDVLHGSGMKLDALLFNRMIRRKKACIYVKITGNIEKRNNK